MLLILNKSKIIVFEYAVVLDYYKYLFLPPNKF